MQCIPMKYVPSDSGDILTVRRSGSVFDIVVEGMSLAAIASAVLALPIITSNVSSQSACFTYESNDRS